MRPPVRKRCSDVADVVEGQAHLLRESVGPIKILVITTTGCFATRDSSGMVQIHHWFFRAKQKEPVEIDSTRSLLVWSCRAPWDDSPAGHITRLQCGGCGLSMLHVRDLPRLRHLLCPRNDLTHLDCTALSHLIRLDCRDNDLDRLDLAGCTSLSILQTAGNSLPVRLLTPLQGREGNLPSARRRLTSTSLFDL